VNEGLSVCHRNLVERGRERSRAPIRVSRTSSGDAGSVTAICSVAVEAPIHAPAPGSSVDRRIVEPPRLSSTVEKNETT